VSADELNVVLLVTTAVLLGCLAAVRLLSGAGLPSLLVFLCVCLLYTSDAADE